MTSDIGRRAAMAVAIAGFVTAVALSGAPQAALGAPTDAPDIVVIMVDDLGAIDERVLSRLPNIRALFLEGGLRFDHAYSETPQCCPGRASFLTGQHTRRHGVTRNDARLFDPSQTLATALHDAGYYTALVGKYMNKAELLTDHTPPGWDHVVMNDVSTKDPSRFWVNDQVVVAGYPDRYTLEQSINALQGAPTDQPAFLWANPRAPHQRGNKAWVTWVEERYAKDKRCQGVEPWKPLDYDYPVKPNGFPLGRVCRGLLTVDEMVGGLRQAAVGRGRPTVWVFTSDNGMSWGRDGYLYKNVPNADRLPLYMAGHGVSGGATDALVSNIDIGPTLAAVAGADMSFADGASFAPVLGGQPGGRSWLLEDQPEGKFGAWWSIRKDQWRLIVFEGDSSQLYDVVSDPWEESPVHNPDVERELGALFPYATTQSSR